jgi:hypothetical protein
MLEELFNLVKGAANDTVINNPEVPNEKNDEIVAEATNTVASGLRNIVAGGGAQNLLSLFGGNNSQQSGGLLSNPIVNMMIGHLSDKLMNKFNLGGTQANNVASGLIPNVISSLINKTKDPSNSTFSLDGLLHSITGGQSSQIAQQEGGSGGGLMDILNQFGGSGGGGGLMDIVSKLASGAQQQQQKNGGGGLMDIIKGFIK